MHYLLDKCWSVWVGFWRTVTALFSVQNYSHNKGVYLQDPLSVGFIRNGKNAKAAVRVNSNPIPAPHWITAECFLQQGKWPGGYVDIVQTSSCKPDNNPMSFILAAQANPDGRGHGMEQK